MAECLGFFNTANMTILEAILIESPHFLKKVNFIGFFFRSFLEEESLSSTSR